MRTRNTFLVAALFAGAALTGAAGAQPAPPPPGEARPGAESGRQPSRDRTTSSVVTRMMGFDKNKDGKLSRDEVTDERLHRLFDRADVDKDGVVTKEEL